MRKVLIIGGGIGGLTTAIALRQRRFNVQVYESTPVLQPLGAGIVLAANAMQVLRRLGLEGEILAQGKLLRHFSILSQVGDVLAQTDSLKVSQRYGNDNFAIHRADLHRVLLAHLGNGVLHLGKRCTGFAQTAREVQVRFDDGTEATGDSLVAADGIHSTIRRQLLPESVPRYAGYTCWRTVIDGWPAGFNGDRATETWGHRGRIGIVPLTGNRIYLFVCKKAPARSEQMRGYTAADLLASCHDYHAPVPQVLAAAAHHPLLWNDILDLAPLRQFAFGRVVLTGDAAHATTPNMGQGACQAIEDALVLANCLEKYPDGEAAFKMFEQKRLARTGEIIRTSRQIGQVAQLENKFLAALRNAAMPWVPESVNEKRLEFLYKPEFAV
jgi:2-polyprenyl-6-methoxyphenol hydroxylase-like FAD-dependent oxidoreductase